MVVVALLVSCSSNSPTADSVPPGVEGHVTDGPTAGEQIKPPGDLGPDKPKAPARWETVSGAAPALVYHTATLLKDGRLLVAGGEVDDGTNPTKLSADTYLYDPQQNSFAPTGKLAVARHSHTATLLNDGRVILVGGGTSHWGSSAMDSVEIFDPTKNSWSSGTAMPGKRKDHTATLLQSGKLLIAGGENKDNGGQLDTLLLFDPAANAWTAPAYTLTSKRDGHTATLLKNGKVLMAGGSDGTYYLSSMEVIDVTAGTAKALTDSLPKGRVGHTAELLGDGRVLVVGGYCGMTCAMPNDALYDPSIDKVTTLSHFGDPPGFHAAAALSDGRALVTGGATDPDTMKATSTASIFASGASGGWTGQPSMAVARMRHTSTTLKDGSVLVVGGMSGLSSACVDKAERFYP
jgi:hypothetical protein